MRTKFPQEIDGALTSRTVSAQNDPSESDGEVSKRELKFPVKVRHRHITVKAYRKTPKYPFYRIAYRADGKRVVRNFKTYALARKEAETKARELAQGNEAGASLPKRAASEYKSVLGKLRDLCADLNAHKADPTAPDVALSLEDALAEFCEAKRKLGAVRLVEAVNCFLTTVASVQRVKVKSATEEFLKEREARTKPQKEGDQPKLSLRMAYQDGLRIKRFSDAFVMDVCDLQPEHPPPGSFGQ